MKAARQTELSLPAREQVAYLPAAGMSLSPESTVSGQQDRQFSLPALPETVMGTTRELLRTVLRTHALPLSPAAYKQITVSYEAQTRVGEGVCSGRDQCAGQTSCQT
jgi:hypothetical protein